MSVEVEAIMKDLVLSGPTIETELEVLEEKYGDRFTKTLLDWMGYNDGAALRRELLGLEGE